MCGCVLNWLFTVIVNWHVVKAVFLFIINCYPIWAAIPPGVDLHVTLPCVTCIVLRCSSLFTSSLWVCVMFCCLCFSKYFRMSSTLSTVLLLDWSHRYCSAIMGLAFKCLLFLVISQPIFVMHIMYDMSLWLWSPLPTTVPWVHSPPSSHWTSTVDPNRKEV